MIRSSTSTLKILSKSDLSFTDSERLKNQLETTIMQIKPFSRWETKTTQHEATTLSSITDVSMEFSSLLIGFTQLFATCTIEQLCIVMGTDLAYLSGDPRVSGQPQLSKNMNDELLKLEKIMTRLELWEAE